FPIVATRRRKEWRRSSGSRRRIAVPMTLGWILAASFAGGTLSAGLAAFSLALRATWVPMLVSYAIGALLGAAFLGVIPEAFAKGPPQQAAVAILGGIFAFFVLEKLLLWRHCHTEHCEVHDPH